MVAFMLFFNKFFKTLPIYFRPLSVLPAIIEKEEEYGSNYDAGETAAAVCFLMALSGNKKVLSLSCKPSTSFALITHCSARY